MIICAVENVVSFVIGEAPPTFQSRLRQLWVHFRKFKSDTQLVIGFQVPLEDLIFSPRQLVCLVTDDGRALAKQLVIDRLALDYLNLTIVEIKRQENHGTASVPACRHQQNRLAVRRLLLQHLEPLHEQARGRLACLCDNIVLVVKLQVVFLDNLLELCLVFQHWLLLVQVRLGCLELLIDLDRAWLPFNEERRGREPKNHNAAAEVDQSELFADEYASAFRLMNFLLQIFSTLIDLFLAF